MVPWLTAAVEEARKGESAFHFSHLEVCVLTQLSAHSVGRWRSKEMFPHGRRTCQLMHTRLGSVNEMD
jgi:hypothetical protein